jgi:hypothetical protein
MTRTNRERITFFLEKLYGWRRTKGNLAQQLGGNVWSSAYIFLSVVFLLLCCVLPR